MFNKVNIGSNLNISKKMMAEIYDMPVIVKVNKFDEEEVDKFSKSMELAQNTGQPVIPIVIDSYGGAVYSLLAMIGIIDQCEVPVATIGLGKMMSCGSVLLSCGTEGYRYSCPNSTVMIHDVSSWSSGKVEEVKASTAQTDKLNKVVFERMAKNCGQPKDYFLKLLFEKHHAEWYLTSREAKKHNIVNTIGIPSFKINISSSVEFGT